MTQLTALPKLKEIREIAGITQEELVSLLKAQEIEFGRSYYARVESGEKQVNSNVALAISRVLSTPVNEIFSLTGESNG